MKNAGRRAYNYFTNNTKMWNARRATIVSHFHLLLSTNSHKGMSKTASNEMIMMMMTFTARSTKDDLDSVNGNITIRYYH